MESYVISVSAGVGCYRHIQISKSATLYQLHGAILRAFDFVDDHAHAFFMDNKTWGRGDAYYSIRMDGHERLTKSRRLEKLNLRKGSQFKYLFDFGEEWRFQCRVLRELEEKTKTPLVIRAVGEAPEQYPEGEDWEEGIPQEMTREELDALYAGIPITREEIHCIHGYMRAAANLYGLISAEELHRLYNSQNNKVDALSFLLAVSVIDYEEGNDFIVIDSKDNPGASLEESMKSCEIVSNYLFVENPERDIRELRRAQKGKPLKILPKEAFLRFADGAYFPETPQRREMIRYLRRLEPALGEDAEDYCDRIQNVISIDIPLGEILSILQSEGVTDQENWDLEEFMGLFQELNNHTHKHANRGHTPSELLEQSSRGLRLRPVPEEQLPFSEEAPQKPTLTLVGGPSRNGPCPCGSGRKYKNCCGKMQS